MTEAVSLTKRFSDIVTVNHIGAVIRGGSVFGLIGTNGARKSTFLGLTSGALKLDEGCITIDGHEIFENAPAKKCLFYISDRQYFLDSTIPEEMMRCCRRMYRESGEARFHKLTGDFGLDEKRKIHTFSKDMKKQVSVICGVYTSTDYLFRDETFDGLDPVMRQTVKSILAADVEGGNLTSIVTFHNPRELEDTCDHVGLLHRGDVLLLENLDDMRLNIHKIRCVLKPGMRPEDLTFLDKVDVEQRGSFHTITARGSRGEVETVMASYESVFSECIPLSLEEIFISETEAVGYDIRKLML